MKAQLKKLTSESIVYGVSSIVGRFINFLLVPFYTNYLPAADYGIVIVVYSYLAFLNVICALGLDTAYMRFAADAASDDERGTIFTNAFLLASVTGAIACVLVIAFQSPIASLSAIPSSLSLIVPLAAGTLMIDTINIVPFAALRMANRARTFAGIKLASILLNVVLNVYFIAVLELSIVAIFLAGLAASVLSAILLLPSIVRWLRWGKQWMLARSLLVLGLPTVPSGIAAIVIQVVDKPLMRYLTDEATTGIYGANYKLGIFMMLIVSMFQYAWQPFYLQNASDPQAPRLFARVLTYFLFVSASICLSLAFFVDDVAMHHWFNRFYLIHPSYWSGLGIVPIVLFSYVFTGISVIFNAGLLIRKRTTLLPIITGAGAVANIALNFWLIPIHGILGGAYATLGAYFLMTVVSFVLTRSVYPVPYEWTRIGKIIVATIIVLVLWQKVNPLSDISSIAGELILFAGYFVLLFLLRFFSTTELREMRNLLKRFSLSGH